jgi:hypothetical protein
VNSTAITLVFDSGRVHSVLKLVLILRIVPVKAQQAASRLVHRVRRCDQMRSTFMRWAATDAKSQFCAQ